MAEEPDDVVDVNDADLPTSARRKKRRDKDGKPSRLANAAGVQLKESRILLRDQICGSVGMA